MRTTLEIDDGVLAAARSIARDEGVSIGHAISALALKGLGSTAPVDTSGGFPSFTSSPDAAPITLELVNEFRD
jgi:hypothetical protein